MNEGNSRGVNVDLNMLNKPGTFLSAHALALYNWLKSPQGLDERRRSTWRRRPTWGASAASVGGWRRTMAARPGCTDRRRSRAMRRS